MCERCIGAHGRKDAQAHGLCTRSKGVRHGDGVVEVDGVRCMELMDNVCATAALTEQREKYMVLVEVVHFFCAAAAALLLVLRANGRKANGRGAR